MSEEQVPISGEVLAHVREQARKAVQEIREVAENQAHPLARAALLEWADELDAENERLFTDSRA